MLWRQKVAKKRRRTRWVRQGFFVIPFGPNGSCRKPRLTNGSRNYSALGLLQSMYLDHIGLINRLRVLPHWSSGPASTSLTQLYSHGRLKFQAPFFFSFFGSGLFKKSIPCSLSVFLLKEVRNWGLIPSAE